MTSVAKVGTLAVLLTYLHLVFGGIVRITGAGMGCGDHWPKCNGSWIPPLSNPLTAIEWTHRLLALLVVLSIAAFAVMAYRRRGEDGVAGPRGVLRPAVISLVLVVAVALLGMVTVKLGNTTVATVAHWTLAMALLGVLIAATVRAGGLGGARARAQGGSARTVRSIGAGAALALAAVVLGGLVAKFPGASVACPGFPLCGDTPANVGAGAAHIQVAHRIVAFVLFFHAIAITMAVGRRAGESAVVKTVARVAAGLVILQLALGAGMVLSQLHQHLRIAHQAVGVAIWLSLFLAAYLSRVAQGNPRPTELAA